MIISRSRWRTALTRTEHGSILLPKGKIPRTLFYESPLRQKTPLLKWRANSKTPKSWIIKCADNVFLKDEKLHAHILRRRSGLHSFFLNLLHRCNETQKWRLLSMPKNPKEPVYSVGVITEKKLLHRVFGTRRPSGVFRTIQRQCVKCGYLGCSPWEFFNPGKNPLLTISESPISRVSIFLERLTVTSV